MSDSSGHNSTYSWRRLSCSSTTVSGSLPAQLNSAPDVHPFVNHHLQRLQPFGVTKEARTAPMDATILRYHVGLHRAEGDETAQSYAWK